MCGIAGFVGFESNETLAYSANKIQAHRGPDHQAIWSDDYVSLAHQRLSIIDLSDRANQPFKKDNLVIIFNGEIYNYKELRRTLEQDFGASFRSDSDTEVVSEYFRVHKEKCLDFFIGMFAFAIYDLNDHSLFMARDHFGIKPIFYYHISGKFAFSSELKTICAIPEIELTLNKRSLISSLNYLWVSGSQSMFNEVQKLPPGHYFTLHKSGRHNLVNYWSLNDHRLDKTKRDWVGDLGQIIDSSVKRHMVADVPVSSFLSGGLDSSLISVLASKHNRQLSTYTIGTNPKDKKIERMPDDQKYARELASANNFNHNEIIISSKIVDLLPEMVRTLDEPIGDPAAINTLLICKEARKKGVKVLLSGMGADELFAGYRRHHATMISRKYSLLPGFVKNTIKFLVNAMPVRVGNTGLRLARWGKRFMEFAQLPLEEAYRRSYSYYDEDELRTLMLDDCNKEIAQILGEHCGIFNAYFEKDDINKMCYTDINMFLLGLNLTYSDRASMAASVEVRVPFVDREVAAFAMSIPGKYKLKSGQGKYVLKRMSEPYLSKRIIYRPKASFGAPIRSWISNELRPLVDDLLSRESVIARGIFNYDFVRSMIEEDKAGKRDHAYRIYQLITIELWFREFVDKRVKLNAIPVTR